MALQTQNENQIAANTQHFDQKQIDILKNSICRGVSNDEFEIFLMACRKTQLDPFMKQIYAVKRPAKKPDGTWGETMTIQTGIDGYRLIAERTGRYVPGPEPTYAYDGEGRVLSATAYIKKQTSDGTWHTVSETAYMEEYCQRKKDGGLMGLWANMPRTMLSKCAEAKVLRKAFPAEMSGVYTKEEMEQADVQIVEKIISPERANELDMILGDCDPKYKKWVFDHLEKQYQTKNLYKIPAEVYERMKSAALKNMNQYSTKQREEIQKSKTLDLVVEEV